MIQNYSSMLICKRIAAQMPALECGSAVQRKPTLLVCVSLERGYRHGTAWGSGCSHVGSQIMKRSLIVSLFALLLLLIVAPAFAGTSTITGTLTSANVLPNGRPGDNGNACEHSLDDRGLYYTL